jgi:hypothetical protein
MNYEINDLVYKLNVYNTINKMFSVNNNLNNPNIYNQLELLASNFNRLNMRSKILLDIKLKNIISYENYVVLLPLYNVVNNDINNNINYGLIVIHKLIDIISIELEHILNNENILLQENSIKINNFINIFYNYDNNNNIVDNIIN